MNSSHATVGISATSAMAALTTLFTGLHGLSGEQAASLAWLVVSGGGALIALVMWFIAWKYPNIPPLPGQVIAIPPNTPATQVAVVESGAHTAVVSHSTPTPASVQEPISGSH